MDPASPLRSLLAHFVEAQDRSADLWQAGMIVASLLVAWVSSRVIYRRISRSLPHSGTGAKFGFGGAHRLLFPLIALMGLVAGRFAATQLDMPVMLLNLAVPLLSSLAIIRAIVYLLRTAFDEAPWLVMSERALAWVVWIGVALHISGVLQVITTALDGVQFEVSGKRISLLAILQAPVVVAVAVVLGLWAGRLIERRLMAAGHIDVNVRVVLSRLIRVLLMVFAVLIALPVLGIDVTVLSVFGGALGVGIGFGLQKVASNYVSGFTILLDRSISPGAMVTVENYHGQVTRVASRYIVVRGLDGTEAIVPNETVVTSVVINHTFSDPRVRLRIPVQVAYRSDVESVLAMLSSVAHDHARVLKDPAPMALLARFADSGIDLELYVWIADPEAGQGNVISDLNREIWRRFNQAGIEIPYPQREIRLIDGAGQQTQPHLQNPSGQP